MTLGVERRSEEHLYSIIKVGGWKYIKHIVRMEGAGFSEKSEHLHQVGPRHGRQQQHLIFPSWKLRYFISRYKLLILRNFSNKFSYDFRPLVYSLHQKLSWYVFNKVRDKQSDWEKPDPVALE